MTSKRPPKHTPKQSQCSNVFLFTLPMQQCIFIYIPNVFLFTLPMYFYLHYPQCPRVGTLMQRGVYLGVNVAMYFYLHSQCIFIYIANVSMYFYLHSQCICFCIAKTHPKTHPKNDPQNRPQNDLQNTPNKTSHIYYKAGNIIISYIQ